MLNIHTKKPVTQGREMTPSIELDLCLTLVNNDWTGDLTSMRSFTVTRLPLVHTWPQYISYKSLYIGQRVYLAIFHILAKHL